MQLAQGHKVREAMITEGKPAFRNNGTALKNWLCVAAIVAVLFVRFYRTIFLGEPISKLFLIANWDPMFYQYGGGPSFAFDPALVELILPYRFFVAGLWHHGVPLWNEFNGFGMPLLADPQSLVLCPIFALFYMIPSIYSWNLTLVLALVIGAVSAYFLFREFEVGFLASVAGALIFTFCPWIQWQLELLANAHCLVPLVFLFFVRAGKENSLWSSAIAGVAAAVDILSVHPEIAFVTIVFATILMWLTAYNQTQSEFQPVSVLHRIVIAGLVAFGISAPALVPFIEYLFNGETYKFGVGSAGPAIPLEALFANFLFPFYKNGSIFFGPLAWVGLTVVVFFQKCNRFVHPLLICLAVCVLAISRTFPFGFLCSHPPFSMIYAAYYVPVYTLLISGLAASGFDALVAGNLKLTRIRRMAAIALSAILLIAPLLFFPWHRGNLSLHFDSTLEAPRFNWRLWLVDACAFVSLISIWAVTANRSRKAKTMGAVIAATLGVLTLILISYDSSPTRPFFQYPKRLPLEVMYDPNSRFLSLGRELFRPNTNAVYGLPTIKVHNPLSPKGYAEFMKACGAKVDGFNQIFPANISPLLDVTGTRTIVSAQPLLDDRDDICSDHGRAGKQLMQQANFGGQLNLSDVRLFQDFSSGAVYCRLMATPQFRRLENYRLCFEMKDREGRSLAFAEPQRISGLFDNQIITCSGFVPSGLKYWTVSLRVFTEKDGVLLQLLRPVSSTSGKLCPDGSWVLASSAQPENFDEVESSRFKILSKCGNIAVYDNKTALDRCFFGSQIQWVQGQEQALQYLKTHSSQIGNVIVLEEFQRKEFDDLLQRLNWTTNSSLGFCNYGSVKRLKDNHGFAFWPTVDLSVSNPNAALLVVSDLYYPSWKAYLDDAVWPVFRADCLFRAVVIPPGEHVIRFVYQPVSFILGATIFIATVITMLFVWFVCYCNNRTRVARIQQNHTPTFTSGNAVVNRAERGT